MWRDRRKSYRIGQPGPHTSLQYVTNRLALGLLIITLNVKGLKDTRSYQSNHKFIQHFQQNIHAYGQWAGTGRKTHGTIKKKNPTDNKKSIPGTDVISSWAL